MPQAFSEVHNGVAQKCRFSFSIKIAELHAFFVLDIVRLGKNNTIGTIFKFLYL